MEDNRHMICDRCRKATLIKDMRYMPDGKGSRTALCRECREKIAVKTNTKPAERSSQKTIYNCTRCNYKFKFDPKGITNLHCPYCGKSDRLEKYKTKSAEEYIKMSDDPQDFFSLGCNKRRL